MKKYTKLSHPLNKKLDRYLTDVALKGNIDKLKEQGYTIEGGVYDRVIEETPKGLTVKYVLEKSEVEQEAPKPKRGRKPKSKVEDVEVKEGEE